YLRHVDLFRRLSDRDAADLSRALTSRRFSAGQLIVGPEPGSERVYLTRSGTVRLFQRHPDGRELTIERLARGHLFGVTTLLGTPSVNGLLAQAETDVEVSVVDERRFLDVMARWPKALLDLATRLGVRVQAANDTLRRVSGTGARGRPPRGFVGRARGGRPGPAGGGVRVGGGARDPRRSPHIRAHRE